LIILPQAFRAIISPLSNEIITLIKDSSLASVIGVTELLKAGKNIISVTYDPFTIYLGIGLLYLILTGFVAFIFGLIERKIKHA
jgi:ABC-type amino acid transport system permease subunit